MRRSLYWHQLATIFSLQALKSPVGPNSGQKEAVTVRDILQMRHETPQQVGKVAREDNLHYNSIATRQIMTACQMQSIEKGCSKECSEVSLGKALCTGTPDYQLLTSRSYEFQIGRNQL